MIRWSPLQKKNIFSNFELIHAMPKFRLVHYKTEEHLKVSETEFIGGNQTQLRHKNRLLIMFEFKRYFISVFFHSYFPAIMMVCLAGLSMWVDANSVPARIGMGVTTILTISTLIQGLKSSLPKVAYLTALDIYLWVCFFFVFAATCEYSFLNYWMTKHEEENDVEIRDRNRRKSNGEKAIRSDENGGARSESNSSLHIINSNNHNNRRFSETSENSSQILMQNLRKRRNSYDSDSSANAKLKRPTNFSSKYNKPVRNPFNSDNQDLIWDDHNIISNRQPHSFLQYNSNRNFNNNNNRGLVNTTSDESTSKTSKSNNNKYNKNNLKRRSNSMKSVGGEPTHKQMLGTTLSLKENDHRNQNLEKYNNSNNLLKPEIAINNNNTNNGNSFISRANSRRMSVGKRLFDYSVQHDRRPSMFNKLIQTPDMTIKRARNMDAAFRPYYFIVFLGFNIGYWSFLIYWVGGVKMNLFLQCF